MLRYSPLWQNRRRSGQRNIADAWVLASGSASSPVCRINEELANRLFAGPFFARKSGLPLILTLIDVYGSAKPIPALFAGCIMISLADLLCFKARKKPFYRVYSRLLTISKICDTVYPKRKSSFPCRTVYCGACERGTMIAWKGKMSWML